MSNRKLLLASIRNGNYTHAGEEEAIDLVLDLITKNPHQKILDVGCGLGGTANYIKQQGYGKVTGVDIDPVILNQAKELYPDIDFHLCDATIVNTFFKNQKFNVFCAFNAFFCFKNQENCLQAFSSIAEENAELLIFDYSSPNQFSKPNPFCDQTGFSTSAASFIPINLSTISEILIKTHWRLNKIINLNNQYKIWYQSLFLKMENYKDDLIKRFGQTPFHELSTSCNRLLTLIEEKEVGGSIIHAKYWPNK